MKAAAHPACPMMQLMTTVATVRRMMRWGWGSAGLGMVSPCQLQGPPTCQTGGMAVFPSPPSPIVVTGANGLVGSRVCAKLVEAGASVCAVVRRSGTAPQLSGVEEVVGEFGDPAFAQSVVQGASAIVTTVHPMGSDEETQHRIAVQGTPVLSRAARDAGVPRLVHISTAAVYDRCPDTGDVDESSPMVGDDADAYAVTKRDTDAALAEIDGINTVLLRPPAILGPGRQSMWNSLRQAAIRDQKDARRSYLNRRSPGCTSKTSARLLQTWRRAGSRHGVQRTPT